MDIQENQAFIDETEQIEKNILTVMYDCNKENNSEAEPPKKIKMSVGREKAFQGGILYSLKGEEGESYMPAGTNGGYY